MFLVGSAVVLMIRSSHRRHEVGRRVTPQATLAWSVRVGDRALVAVLASGGGRPPIVVAIPGDTVVDLPGGGPRSVGEAGRTPGLLMAAVQAGLGRRIGHYLVSQAHDLARLIDGRGGVQVQVEPTFRAAGQMIGPGPERLDGVQAVAYLASGTNIDRSARWEGVVAGLIMTGGRSSFPRPSGRTDDLSAVTRILSGVRGATVMELPTTPAVGGGRAPDSRAISELLRTRLTSGGGALVRVVVLNGNGRPGMGVRIASILAPRGFRVVASQNARSFAAKGTKIVASESAFLGRAEEVKKLLGVGKVYVGTIPAGSADVTILVGRDFT